MNYKSQVFIPFHFADPAGILFFSQAFVLAHQAYEEWIVKSLKFKWEEWFQNSIWILPIKHAEAEYHHALFAGQPCDIQLQVTEVRNSSFCVEYFFFQNEIKCCIVKTVHVFCDKEAKMKMEIPASIRSKLAPSTYSEAILECGGLPPL